MEDSGVDMFEQLIGLNGEAFETRQFEVAYHILDAALHRAYNLKDRQRLHTVATLAHEQGTWIDTHAPESLLSTQSAIERGGRGVYHILERQASAYHDAIQVEERLSSIRRDVNTANTTDTPDEPS